MDSTCLNRFKVLKHRILEPSSRSAATQETARLDRAISVFRSRCEPALAEVLAILLDFYRRRCALSEAVRRLQELLDDQHQASYVSIQLLTALSKLTFTQISDEENFALRQRALSLADQSDFKVEAATVLTNWLFASLTLRRFDEARKLVEELGARYASLPLDAERDPDFYYAKTRFLAHRAWLRFRDAHEAHSWEECLAAIQEGNELYNSALERHDTENHRRVNLLTEWADQLIALLVFQRLPETKTLVRCLKVARSGLDTHDCDPCRGYFCVTQARYRRACGDLLFNALPSEALRQWRLGRVSCEESIRAYSAVGHYLVREPHALKEALLKRIEMMERPKLIFLSHRHVDKELVRRFARLLKVLGFEPWLDEVANEPWENPSRGINKGMRQSCACVFFITPRFSDDKYVRDEISLALRLRTELGEDNFRVIPLVFGSNTPVPEILADSTTYHAFENELEAFEHLVKWLPVRVGAVHFRTEAPLLEEDI